MDNLAKNLFEMPVALVVQHLGWFDRQLEKENIDSDVSLIRAVGQYADDVKAKACGEHEFRDVIGKSKKNL